MFEKIVEKTKKSKAMSDLESYLFGAFLAIMVSAVFWIAVIWG